MAAPHVLRMLLRAYPPALQRAHGEEMASVVAEHWRDRPAARARLSLVVDLVLDFLASWAREGRARLAAHHPSQATQGSPMRHLSTDLRSAVRLFVRTPLFSAGAVITLALGIGAATAIFSLADATLLRPLPVPSADRVVQATFSWSHPDFRDLLAQQDVFTSTAAWTLTNFGVERNGATEKVVGSGVSGQFFTLAGQRAVVGRLLTDADDVPGAPPVAVVSERLWRRLLDGNPQLVGSTVLLNRRPVGVVGILPAAFRGMSLRDAPEIFVPISALPTVSTGFLARPGILEKRSVVWLQVAGRLRGSTTIDQAERETDAIYRRLHPPKDQTKPIAAPTKPGDSTMLVPLTARAVGLDGVSDLRRFILVLLGATAVTLLLACATVANLMLVRAEHRRRELAVRAALGAGRWRLGRLLLFESLAIGVAGSVAGLVVAKTALMLLHAFTLPSRIPIAELGLTLNPRVLAASMALGVLTSLLFGLAPIWHSLRLDLTSTLRDGSRGTPRQSLRAVLVAAQVAFCVLLLGGSLAFGRAVRYALALDLGFDTEHTSITTIEPGLVRASRQQMIDLQRQSLDALGAQRWVAAAAWSAVLPLTGSMRWLIAVPGYEPPEGQDMTLETNVVSGAYLDAMGIPLVAGRPIAETDTLAAPTVAVISESAARKFWPAGGALGSRLSLDPESTDPHSWATVVGIAGDVKRGPDAPRSMMLYLAAAQQPAMGDFAGGNNLIVRSKTLAPEAAIRETAVIVRRLDPMVPIPRAQTMREHLDGVLMAHRLGLTLFLLFASLAVVLTAFGIYAVVAYAVAARTREIGIRIALGAAPRGVLRLVVRQGVAPIGFGLAAGLAAFAGTSAALDRFMFALPANTGSSMTVLALAVGVVAALAMLVPARRALAVDAAIALRSE